MSNPGSTGAGIPGTSISDILTSEAITSGVFAYLPTPDKVTVITKGPGRIGYSFCGFWAASAAGGCQAQACIVVNDVQVVGLYTATSPLSAPTTHSPPGFTQASGAADSGNIPGSTVTRPVYTTPEGLASDNTSPGVGGESAQDALPQMAGCLNTIWVPAAGTYTIGVQWKLLVNAYRATRRRLIAFPMN